MKKVSGYYSENIPIVKLFLEDIEEMINILNNYTIIAFALMNMV